MPSSDRDAKRHLPGKTICDNARHSVVNTAVSALHIKPGDKMKALVKQVGIASPPLKCRIELRLSVSTLEDNTVSLEQIGVPWPLCVDAGEAQWTQKPSRGPAHRQLAVYQDDNI